MPADDITQYSNSRLSSRYQISNYYNIDGQRYLRIHGSLIHPLIAGGWLQIYVDQNNNTELHLILHNELHLALSFPQIAMNKITCRIDQSLKNTNIINHNNDNLYDFPLDYY